MWDTEKREHRGIDHHLQGARDLRISGDRSKIFYLDVYSIRAYSIQTGELVGRVVIEMIPGQRSLIVDGSRVWVHSPNLGYEGWEFGIPGSLPGQLHNIPPYRLHPSGVIVWDTSLSIIKDQATGKVVFQLSERFKKPVDVQWNGPHLILCYTHKEVLILDFSHLFLL